MTKEDIFKRGLERSAGFLQAEVEGKNFPEKGNTVKSEE